MCHPLVTCSISAPPPGVMAEGEVAGSVAQPASPPGAAKRSPGCRRPGGLTSPCCRAGPPPSALSRLHHQHPTLSVCTSRASALFDRHAELMLRRPASPRIVLSAGVCPAAGPGASTPTAGPGPQQTGGRSWWSWHGLCPPALLPLTLTQDHPPGERTGEAGRADISRTGAATWGETARPK